MTLHRPSMIDRVDIDSTVSDSGDDGTYDTARESHTAGMGETRGSGGGLDQGFESWEEDQGGREEETTDSSSDSVTSEVMVVRTR